MWCDADGDSEIDRNWINSCNMDAVCCIYGMDLYVFYAVFPHREIYLLWICTENMSVAINKSNYYSNITEIVEYTIGDQNQFHDLELFRIIPFYYIILE